MPLDYDNYDALSFDCYGTLIDWESGIWLAFQPLLVENPHLQIDQNQVLAAFAEFENEIQSDHPDMSYPEVLKRIHSRFALSRDLVTNEKLDTSFGASVGGWPAFPDSMEALADLKKRYTLAILSNVDDVGFAASNEHLGVEFDAIYTAQKIGTYKPNVRNFEFLLPNYSLSTAFPENEYCMWPRVFIMIFSPQKCWVWTVFGSIGRVFLLEATGEPRR